MTSAWLVFAASIITLLVTGKAKRRFRPALGLLSVAAFGVAMYLTLRSPAGSENLQQPPPSPVVQQETKGDQSPTVQGVNGSVTITNQQTEKGGRK